MFSHTATVSVDCGGWCHHRYDNGLWHRRQRSCQLFWYVRGGCCMVVECSTHSRLVHTHGEVFEQHMLLHMSPPSSPQVHLLVHEHSHYGKPSLSHPCVSLQARCCWGVVLQKLLNQGLRTPNRSPVHQPCLCTVRVGGGVWVVGCGWWGVCGGVCVVVQCIGYVHATPYLYNCTSIDIYVYIYSCMYTQRIYTARIQTQNKTHIYYT